MLTRRDLLAAFLGSAVACTARKEELLPPGEIVGASHAVGHRLRGGAIPTPSRWETHDVVIVGGGIAGLAAAWRLHGHRDAVVFELEPAAGGTSRSAATYPWGAHYVIAPSEQNEPFRRLLEQMGVMERGEVREEFLCRDPEERLYYRGRWYAGLYPQAGASHEDLAQLRQFDSEIITWMTWRDGRGRPAFAIPVEHGSDDADVRALDRISMKQWMDERGLTSPRLRWYVEYACRDDYGTLLAETSAWAGVFYFASREQRPVITWPEGNGRIVKHLSRYARTRTGWLIASLRPTADGVDLIALRGDEAVGVHARHVIVAAPQFVAAALLPARTEARAFTYGSWMVANLALRGRPSSRGFPLAWDNVIYDSPSLGYVVATHQQGIDHGPTTLTYYYPLTDADPRRARARLLETSRDQWADIALTDLSRAHPEMRSLATRLDVMRWGHAMVRPSPGFIWSRERLGAAQPLGNIHFANTDLSGVALFEEALHHGVRAAEEVLVESPGRLVV